MSRSEVGDRVVPLSVRVLEIKALELINDLREQLWTLHLFCVPVMLVCLGEFGMEVTNSSGGRDAKKVAELASRRTF